MGLCLAVALTACGDALEDGQRAGSDALRDSPVITETEHANAYPTAEVSGLLTLQGGCLFLDNKPVFWPYGTNWDEEAQAVVFSDAAPFDNAPPASVNATFDGGGAYYPSDTDFESWRGKVFATAIERCLAQAHADVVLYAYPSTRT